MPSITKRNAFTHGYRSYCCGYDYHDALNELLRRVRKRGGFHPRYPEARATEQFANGWAIAERECGHVTPGPDALAKQLSA